MLCFWYDTLYPFSVSSSLVPRSFPFARYFTWGADCHVVLLDPFNERKMSTMEAPPAAEVVEAAMPVHMSATLKKKAKMQLIRERRERERQMIEMRKREEEEKARRDAEALTAQIEDVSLEKAVFASELSSLIDDCFKRLRR